MNDTSKSKPLKILCVDDDKDFLNYLSSTTENFNILLDISETVESADKKIISNNYDAYIVDLKLPDGSGFDLVEKIRAKGDFPIAVISGTSQDEDSFRLLKETHKIDYVLSKPLYQHHFTKLISLICNKNVLSLEKSLDDPEQQLASYYLKTICDKIDLLTKLVNAVRSHPDEASLTALRDAVHKIAGSAGSYGYPEVSQICKELELDLQDKIKNIANIPAGWLEELNVFLNKIKYHFQVPTSQNRSIYIKNEDKIGVRDNLYVLDSDEKFINLLEREKERFNIHLETETDLALGKAHLKEDHFHPRMVLIGENFPGSEVTGFDLIEEMQKSPSYLSTKFGIILSKENLDTRLKAAKKKIDYVFCKPVSPLIILETASKELKPAFDKGVKVLVLDDDQDVCKYIEEAFRDLGILVKSINEPSKLYQELENFMPHVLLLDILLPKYDGLDLLKVLRSDPLYKELIIVIITHYRDVRAKEMAYNNNVNDIFYKPLDKSILQMRVLNIVKHIIQSKGDFPGNLRVGLNSFQMLITKLQSVLLQPQSATLALFEINKYSDYLLRKTNIDANKLLIAISNLITKTAHQNISGYYIHDSKFALLFENKDITSIEDQMRTLLSAAKLESEASISFCCGIVPITKQFGNAEQVLKVAEECVRDAGQNDEHSPVKICIYNNDKEPKIKKEVLLVDPDAELLKMTKKALESYGIDVSTFTTGEEALKVIYQHSESNPPALIISERKIPDMDGLDFFERVRNRFHNPIPFYFLTAYSSDQDISEGIRYGALEYITKPFNMSLLVQRVLKTLNTR